jgi:uncharacterized RDD family membrane protein YckC
VTAFAGERRRAGICSRFAAHAVSLAATVGGAASLLELTGRALGRFGRRLPPKTALLRLAGGLPSALPLEAGFWWVVGPRRLAWPDRLARTEVVHLEPPPPEQSVGELLRRRLAGARHPSALAGEGSR